MLFPPYLAFSLTHILCHSFFVELIQKSVDYLERSLTQFRDDYLLSTLFLLTNKLKWTRWS